MKLKEPLGSSMGRLSKNCGAHEEFELDSGTDEGVDEVDVGGMEKVEGVAEKEKAKEEEEGMEGASEEESSEPTERSSFSFDGVLLEDCGVGV